MGVTDDLAGTLSAVDLVKAAVAALGGQGGGGRPDMAQGGGPDGAKAERSAQRGKGRAGESRGLAATPGLIRYALPECPLRPKADIITNRSGLHPMSETGWVGYDR